MRQNDPRLSIAAFLGATALVLTALVAFARYPSLFRSGREYRADFRNVAGLNLGDEVRYGGLTVGSVTAMELGADDPTRVVVRFRVRRRTPVRADTRASIAQIGLLGQPYLALESGAGDAPPLAAGGTLPTEENLSFQQAMNQLALFFVHADTVFAGLDRASRRNPLDRLDRTLQRLEVLVDNTSRGSGVVIARMDTASRRLNAVLERTERVVASVDTTVKSAGPDLAATQREALATLREMRTLVADLRDATQQGGGVEQIVRNMQVASENLARLSARLEREPMSVLKRRQPPVKTAGPSARE